MAMPQRDNDREVGSGRPLTTGEFRAAPDASASTAQFRAFADGETGNPEAPWEMKAPKRSVARLAGIIAAVVVVLVIIAIVVMKL
jgi:hypothetical protein